MARHGKNFVSRLRGLSEADMVKERDLIYAPTIMISKIGATVALVVAFFFVFLIPDVSRIALCVAAGAALGALIVYCRTTIWFIDLELTRRSGDPAAPQAVKRDIST
jgi:hypothetical protein